MRGWIILGLGVGLLYYAATETNKLDEPIAQSEALLKNIERKIHAMTGTTAIKNNDNRSQLKQEIAKRLSPRELTELDKILDSNDSLQEFKSEYCGASADKHENLSQENIYFICDKLR